MALQQYHDSDLTVERMTVCVSPRFRECIRQEAERTGLSVSEFVRRAAKAAMPSAPATNGGDQSSEKETCNAAA